MTPDQADQIINLLGWMNFWIGVVAVIFFFKEV